MKLPLTLGKVTEKHLSLKPDDPKVQDRIRDVVYRIAEANRLPHKFWNYDDYRFLKHFKEHDRALANINKRFATDTDSAIETILKDSALMLVLPTKEQMKFLEANIKEGSDNDEALRLIKKAVDKTPQGRRAALLRQLDEDYEILSKAHEKAVAEAEKNMAVILDAQTKRVADRVGEKTPLDGLSFGLRTSDYTKIVMRIRYYQQREPALVERFIGIVPEPKFKVLVKRRRKPRKPKS